MRPRKGGGPRLPLKFDPNRVSKMPNTRHSKFTPTPDTQLKKLDLPCSIRSTFGLDCRDLELFQVDTRHCDFHVDTLKID